MNKDTMNHHYGLEIVEIDGDEYAVARSAIDAKGAARDAIHGSLWSFRPEFLVRFIKHDDNQEEAVVVGIELLQKRLSEDAQPLIGALVGDRLEELVEAAIAADGRGHFLSPYDGREKDGSDKYTGVEGYEGCFLYRIS